MCETVDFFDFEQSVHSLASELHNYDVGARLPAGVTNSAEQIADILNMQRKELREEFPETVNTELLERINEAIKAEKAKRYFEQSQDAITGLAALDEAFRPRYEQLERIGKWIGEVLPKSPRTSVKPIRVINTLLSHPDLALYTPSLQEETQPAPANQLTGPSSDSTEPVGAQTDLPLTPETSIDYQQLVPVLADELMSILIQYAKSGEMRTKIGVRTNEFRAVLQEHSLEDADEKALFHDAWEFVVACFSDHDSDYQLFNDDGGSTRGRRYVLNDPDIAELFWNTEDEDEVETDAPQQPDTNSQLETPKDNPAYSPAQNAALEILKSIKKDHPYIGVNNIARQISDCFEMPQSEAKKEINNLIRQLDKKGKIEFFYSSRRSKRLIRMK